MDCGPMIHPRNFSQLADYFVQSFRITKVLLESIAKNRMSICRVVLELSEKVSFAVSYISRLVAVEQICYAGRIMKEWMFWFSAEFLLSSLQ